MGNPLESIEFNAGGTSLAQQPEWQDDGFDDITRQAEDEVERQSPSKDMTHGGIGQRTADQPPRAGTRPGGPSGQPYQPAFGQTG